MNLKRGALLVAITAVISGLSIFLNSYAVKGFNSSVFTFSKNITVTLLLFAVIYATTRLREIKALTRKQWAQLAFIGLIGGSIPFILFFKGLQISTGTTASFIHKTMFIPIIILSFLFLREKLHGSLVTGAVLLFAGCALLVRPDFSFSNGHLLIAAATLLWAAENTYAKHVLRELRGTTVAFGRMLFGSLFILLYLITEGTAHLTLQMSAAQYAWIGLTSTLLFGFVITYYNGLREIPASIAGCILVLSLPITSLLAWTFQDVAVTLADAAGMTLILLGLGLVAWLHPSPILTRSAATHASR